MFPAFFMGSIILFKVSPKVGIKMVADVIKRIKY